MIEQQQKTAAGATPPFFFAVPAVIGNNAEAAGKLPVK